MATNYKKFWEGLQFVPKTTSTSNTQGDLEVLSTDGKLRFYNGVSNSPVVTETHTATLENKTIDADLNLILDLEVDNLKAGVLNTDLDAGAATDAQIPSALAVQTYVGAVGGDVSDLVTLTGVPAGSTDLGTFTGTVIPDGSDIKEALQALETSQDEDTGDVTDLITLTGVPENSTDLGTFTGTVIPDGSDIKESLQSLETYSEGVNTALLAHINDTTAAHAASAISLTPTGSVTATDVQAGFAQLAAAGAGNVQGPASATDNAVVRFDGTTGKAVQNSLVIISDVGAVSGVTSLAVSGQSNLTNVAISGEFREGIVDDPVSGSNATISVVSSPIIRLTNPALVSVSNISGPSVGVNYTIINATGNPVTIINGSGILTGTKASLVLGDEASIIAKYDSTEASFMVIGGTGSGAGAALDSVFQLTGSDIAQWATGDNAAFLGGGTLSGAFIPDVTPLNGAAGYRYTQAAGSLNDYLASPAQAVPVRFRGTPVTLSFPYLYNGGSSDIEVIFYDVTNSAIIPSSVFLPTATSNSIFKTNITIPATTASMRVGFMVRTLSSGSVFRFDDVVLSANNVAFADVANQKQTSLVSQTATFAAGATITGAATISGGGIYTYNSATGVYTVVKKATFSISATMSNAGATSCFPYINTSAGGTFAISSGATGAGSWAEASLTTELNVGTTFNILNNSGGGSTSAQGITVVATASNANILTAPDTFSTDTNGLTYASSATYTLATLANAPVGTFITFTFASASSNTRTQTPTAPTQTTADMNVNGILLYTRAFNATSTAAQPAVVAIQIGKGLKGRTLDIYKAAAKTTGGSLDVSGSTQKIGAAVSYTESTGILIIDAGVDPAGVSTTAQFAYGDNTTTANGYVVINASKNPALTGLNISAVAAQAQNTSGPSIASAVAVPLTYDAVKTYDTHGALNSATGIFTAPEAGYYAYTASILFVSAAWTAGSNFTQLFVIKNGVNGVATYFPAQASGTYQMPASISNQVFLAKGDTFQINIFYGRTAGATTTALATSTNLNYFSIAKVSVG